ncbi:MAG TPA: MaoC family dehydratase [Gaiellaceae bacterium]|jgi:acyl dehydratase|nr:MaoC family dehydratase [Gaiellaceae bacterium]
MRVFATVEELVAAAGDDLGESSWHTITQEQINGFAEATGDDQWIHVDAVRAAAGPFGTTIAHGYLTLSLVPMLMREVQELRTRSMEINYGLDRVRFLTPVPAGSRVRGRVTVANVTPVDGGVQVTYDVTIELEGSEKPAAIVNPIYRYIR